MQHFTLDDQSQGCPRSKLNHEHEKFHILFLSL